MVSLELKEERRKLNQTAKQPSEIANKEDRDCYEPSIQQLRSITSLLILTWQLDNGVGTH